MPKLYPEIAVLIPEIWLPAPHVDLSRWAVIACDQFTSQPEYWRSVEEWVGAAPSTLRLILPEVYLDQPDCAERIRAIHRQMADYLQRGWLMPYPGMIYVERTLSNAQVRRGLVLALDLEQYDYRPSSASLIRATEGTILERLPPRIKVRRGAPLELTHILALIDDPEDAVLQAAAQARSSRPPLYSLELPFNSGHCSGWLVDQPQVERAVIQALQRLAQPEAFRRRHGLGDDQNLLLFAIGDGNHSFAAARAYWEELKAQPDTPPDHPARYALVEVVNLHDPAVCFEPIHRVAFGLKVDPAQALCDPCGGKLEVIPCQSADPLHEMTEAVDRHAGAGHALGLITAQGCFVMRIAAPKTNLPVGVLQPCLDALLAEGKARRVDYIHGAEALHRLSVQPSNAGFYLPPTPKEALFRTVILDGALPRKTFSLGQAQDKRFYMECRKIVR